MHMLVSVEVVERQSPPVRGTDLSPELSLDIRWIDPPAYKTGDEFAP